MQLPKVLVAFTLFLLVCAVTNAQQAATLSTPVLVPRLVNFSGQAIQDGKIITGVAGATFAIYNEESGGSALWLETQSIQADAKGNYTVQLGATKPEGLPLDLFASGQARWLGVTINGGEEEARVLLLSVPYALKAADSQTLGGLPASAFVLAAPASGGSVADGSAISPSSAAALQPALAGSGMADYVPLWTPNGSTLGDSVLFQTGTGSSAKIGINTTTPAATLDVSGGETVRGLLNLPPAGTATASVGVISRPLGLVAQTFNSSSSTTANQAFHWQAEPVANNTASPSASLNLLFGTAPAAAVETGLQIASNGQITFAPGQTFPGAGGTGAAPAAT
jgi:hypothetical protein